MRTLKITVIALLAGLMLVAPASLIRAADAPPTTTPSAGGENGAGPEKFYAQIKAVDVNAKTITVGDQTFHIVGESQMTKAADGSSATLADATVGDYARGTYTKAADGSLNITKVRFGRKSGGSKSGGKSGGKKKNGGGGGGGATTQPEN